MADNNTPTKIKSADEIKVKRKPSDIIFTIVFTIICAFWVYPLIMVLINSFKENLSIGRRTSTERSTPRWTSSRRWSTA